MNRKKHREFLKKSIAVTLALGTSTIFAVARAEEETLDYQLDTIVVTATKVEQSIEDVPASVTVITAEDIAKMNVQTLDQALRMAVGVFDSRGKGLTATTTAITLRGFTGQQRTLVLLDGQPLNQAYSGSVSWSAIPLESVERVEIVKGSNSALYGGSAMGGVINIITKKPQKQDIQVSIKTETHDSQDYRLDVSDKINDHWSYRFGYEKKKMGGYASGLVTLSRASTDGASTAGIQGWSKTTNSTGDDKYIVGDTGNNTWDENTVNGKLMYRIDDDKSISFSVLHDKYEYGYENGHNYLTDSAGNPFTSGYFAVDGGHRARIYSNTFLGLPGGRESNVYALGYDDKGHGITFNAGLNDVVSSWYISNTATTATVNSGTGRISDAPSKRWNIDLQKELSVTDKDRMVVGVNYRHDWIHNQENNLSNWTDYNSITGLYSQAEGRSRTVALFVQDEHKLNDQTSITFGGRYDSWKNYDGVNQTTIGGVLQSPTYYDARSDSAFSPKIAVMYKASEDSQVHLSWGKSFSSPDLYNMYRSWISTTNPPAGSTGTLYDGNPDLEPELVTSWELGWNRKMGAKTNVSLTYFQNTIKNMVYRQDLGINYPSTTYRWQKFMNAGEGENKGVELELNQRFSDKWSGFFNYTHQRPIITKNSADPDTVGKLVQQAPKEMFNIGFDYQHDKWRGRLAGSYVSKRYGQDDNSDVINGVYGSYDPYFIANMNIVYQYDPQTSMTFGVDNLFDRQYYGYYIAPGRTYSLQVTRKF